MTSFFLIIIIYFLRNSVKKITMICTTDGMQSWSELHRGSNVGDFTPGKSQLNHIIFDKTYKTYFGFINKFYKS